MPISCTMKTNHGLEHCRSRCGVLSQEGLLDVREVRPGEPAPAPCDSLVDVVMLDMHHGWPSLGFDSILFAIRDSLCDVGEPLREAGVGVRVLLHDVRRELSVPRHRPGVDRLYVGTGGPGHYDPARNDGIDPLSQGIRETTSWTKPYGELLDAILADEQAAYLAVCHSFGLLCQHVGIAKAVVRGEEKGGKSSGVIDVAPLDAFRDHPWFSGLAELFPGGRVPALDSRFYDLIPLNGNARGKASILAFETLGRGGPRGEALTLAEFARDPGGVVPRVIGSNFHPELVPGPRARLVLEEKYAAGKTSREWYEERLRMLEAIEATAGEGDALHVSSDFTFLGPLRFHLYRLLRERLERVGAPHPLVDERRVFDQLPRSVASDYSAPGAPLLGPARRAD
jgi:hypothetical protein